MKALICGLARQCAAVLPASFARIDELRGCFDLADLLFATNDSDDGTDRILTEWSATKPASVVHADGLAASVSSRTDRLAMVRNLCLAELQRRASIGILYDVLLVLDMDGVNAKLTTGQEFVYALNCAPPDWAAVFGNQRQAYFDVWALRHETWCPNDCWKEVNATAKAASRWAPRDLRGRLYEYAARRARTQLVGKKQVHIPPEAPPIRVESAFGGIGIYKTSWLTNVWYGGRDNDGHETCEHVVLNRQIHTRGGKLYILPKLLNDAPSEHLHPGSGSDERPWQPSAQSQSEGDL